ncbi:MarR family transcriptional regulator [Rapidithrix thailandica]|uniref:MarR family transcriptional regulator n=1 Tax=Rapidithrix thailandica TaxID=413964 RepID=A0AAW9SER6_9BACT
MALTLREQQVKLIERISAWLEQEDHVQPAVARVLALLFVSDDPELTFDDIRETLLLSKSATSNAINMLLQVELIEYHHRIGERKRYFRLRIFEWQMIYKKLMQKRLEFHSILREVAKQRTQKTPEFNQKILEIANHMDKVTQEMIRLLSES